MSSVTISDELVKKLVQLYSSSDLYTLVLIGKNPQITPGILLNLIETLAMEEGVLVDVKQP